MTSSGSPQSLLASGFPELISVVVRWYLRQGLDPPAPRSRSALDRSGRTGAGPGGGPRQRRAGGYRRIHGEVAVLAHKIAPSTVWQIKDAGIDPAPERSAQTWRAFPEAPAKTILAAGFMLAPSCSAACMCCCSSSTAPGRLQSRSAERLASRAE